MKRENKPISIVPFTIYNRRPFIENEHPTIHPDDPEWNKYWISITEKCLYGLWGEDKKGDLGGWRWMPGNLYWYVNLTPIELQGDENSAKLGTPTLRDIDWLKLYGLNTCDGFSGYEGDEERSCYAPLGKLQNGGHLKNSEKKMLIAEAKYITKADGTYKKYIDPRELLYMTHDKPLGKPLWRNEATNWLELTTRGVGKSYTLANAVICYDYVFNGCRNLEDLIEGKKNTTMVVGSSLSDYSDDLMNKFSVTYDYLRTHHGYFNDGITETTGFFWHPYEGQLTTKGKPFTNRVQLEGSQGYSGAGSKIYNVTYYKKDDAGIGKRCRKYITDEAGTLENFKEVHGLNDAAQNRESKFGFSAYSGTGGNMTKIVGIKDAFENPDAYDILPYLDLFSYNNSYTGLFIPVYYRKDIYRDENGNIDLQAAYEDELEDRNKKRKKSTTAYDKHVTSYPFYPHEMFMQAKDNLFPTVLLQDRLDDLEGGLWEEIAKPGWLEYIDNEKTEIQFRLDLQGELEILNRYGSEKTSVSKKGGIVIYEMPMPDKPDPRYSDPLYITVYDPVANEGEGSSLCAVIVFKFFYPKDLSKVQFNVVAEWYGRHDTLDENHEVAFKLAKFYGSKMLPELNNSDVLRNGRDTMRWHVFQPKPKGALGEFNQTKAYDVGVYITPGMKPAMAMYLNELFNIIVGKDIEEVEGEFIDKIIRMASQLPSIRICDEALQYGEGNFDAISGMFLVSLIHRNTILIPTSTNTEDEETIRSYKKFVKRKTVKTKYHPAYTK